MKQMCDRDRCDFKTVKQSRKDTYNAMQDRLDDFVKELEKNELVSVINLPIFFYKKRQYYLY